MASSLTRRRLRQIIKEELNRARMNLNESGDDYYGDDDPAASYENLDTAVIDAYDMMDMKPTGVIVDVRSMEGSGSGMYPAYVADGVTAEKFSEDVGNFAFDLMNLLKETGSLPEGIYIASVNPDTDVLEIINAY